MKRCQHRMSAPVLSIVLALLLPALFLAACGSDASDADASGATDDGAMNDGAMDDGAMDDDAMDHGAMNMGDPDATRADQVEGGEMVTGEFVLLSTRPEGFDDTAGMAWMTRHDGGTTVTIELTGLEPNTAYISHVHADTCANSGGDHYQFEVGGSVMPPNEIHLAFTSDADGNGFMTAENDAVAGPEAVALVIHPEDLLDNKITCVDFVS